MKQYFANFGYLILSFIGAIMAYRVLEALVFTGGSPMSQFLSNMLGGIM